MLQRPSLALVIASLIIWSQDKGNKNRDDLKNSNKKIDK